MNKSGVAPANRLPGDPIAPKDGKRTYVEIEGYEDFKFYALRWIRGAKVAEKSDKLTWCLYTAEKDLALSWADTKPECIRLGKEWMDGCGGPAWLSRRLGRYDRFEVPVPYPSDWVITGQSLEVPAEWTR